MYMLGGIISFVHCNTEVVQEVGCSEEQVNLLVEVDEEEQLSVEEGVEAFAHFI